MEQKFKTGFVSIIGRTNVGKSTLLNRILKDKVAIVSDKPQTTRNTIKGILTDEDSQIAFIDTPGIHKSKNKLGKQMVESTIRTLNQVDAVIFITDGIQIGLGDKYIINVLKEIKTPTFYVLNKIDLEDNLSSVDELKKQSFSMGFKDFISISALKNINIRELVIKIKELMPYGPKYYPDDMIVDQPENFIICELIREKALRLLEQEVPHGLVVEIEEKRRMEKSEGIFIRATIFCERDSHKKIIIGNHGTMIKRIGKQARLDIENLLGSKIYLDIWIKTKKDWRNMDSFIKRIIN